MRRSSSLFLLAVAAAGPALAQQDATPLLQQVVAVYKSATGFHSESVTEGELTGELHRSWLKSVEILARDASGGLRAEALDRGGSHIVVSNGEPCGSPRPTLASLSAPRWPDRCSK